MVDEASGASRAGIPLSSDDLFRAHAQRVAGWVGRLAGPTADVEDLVQEVFLRVHRSIGNFRGEAQVTTWLYRITENVVHSHRQKERWRRFFRTTTDVDNEVKSPSPSPQEDLERRHSTDILHLAIDRLPDKYRSILILFEIDGMPGDEIAILTGIKLPTLWVRLARARTRLFTAVERLEKQRRNS